MTEANEAYKHSEISANVFRVSNNQARSLRSTDCGGVEWWVLKANLYLLNLLGEQLRTYIETSQ